MRRIVGFAVLVACLVVISLVVLMRPKVDVATSAVEPRSTNSEPTDAETPIAPETRMEAESHPPKTEREVLMEFWGDAWPDVEARLRVSGRNLDQVALVSPWEEAEALIEPHMRVVESEREVYIDRRLEWPDELTATSLRTALRMKLPENLSDEEIGQIALTAEPFNVDLREKAESWVGQLEGVIRQKWDSKQFDRAPITTQGIRCPAVLPFYSTSKVAAGWTIVLNISDEEHPEFAALDSEIAALKRSRRNAVSTYLEGR